jgi:hypothetical protein
MPRPAIENPTAAVPGVSASTPYQGASSSRIDAVESLVARQLKITKLRPAPPRDLMFDGATNVLTWRPPVKTNLATHYRVRIDKDAGDPDYELSLGQTSLPIAKGTKVWITAYNQTNDRESEPRTLTYTLGRPSYLEGGTTGNLFIYSVTVSVEPPNDFGLRFYRVTIIYNLPVPIGGFVRVGMWTKDHGSATDTPKDQGVSDYRSNLETSPGQAHCFFLMAPPSVSTVYDLWLTKGTQISMEPLDVAASAHSTFTLLPLAPSAGGHEYCANVTGLTAGTPTTFTDANGVLKYKVPLTWTNPVDPQFAHAEIIEQRPGPQYVFIGSESGQSYTAILDCPFAVETHYLWVRSVDRLGKKNTLSGDCPKVAVTIGSVVGQLNLTRALESSLGPALGVVNNVLGVVPYGITEDLIGTFAVSQAKLANTPIIDTARIEDLAVTTEKCTNLMVTRALIAYEAVDDSKIANLAVEKLLAGTIAVAVKLVSPWIAIPGSTAIDIRAGQFTVAGPMGTLNLYDGQIDISEGAARAEFSPLGMYVTDGTHHVQGTAEGSFSGVCGGEGGGTYSLDTQYIVNGVTRINAAGAFNAVSLGIGGVAAIDSSRNGLFVGLSATGDITATGVFKQGANTGLTEDVTVGGVTLHFHGGLYTGHT